MASKSRWADAEEDAKVEALQRQEKEEKRRKKAEKARKHEEEKLAAAAAADAADAAARQEAEAANGHDDNDASRPSKRRKLTPSAIGDEVESKHDDGTTKLLRFEGGGWDKSRSVENYDKLNDIEEGTYGWVARGTERSTGKVVALKKLKLETPDRNDLPVTGLREIQILQDCRHRNIVQLHEVVVGGNTNKPDK